MERFWIFIETVLVHLLHVKVYDLISRISFLVLVVSLPTEHNQCNVQYCNDGSHTMTSGLYAILALVSWLL